MRRGITIGARYRHFKGNIYRVESLATHTETGETLVIYLDLQSRKTYARPIDMFTSLVDKDKYPKCEQTYRFELVN